MDTWRTQVICLQLGHPCNCKHSSWALVRLVALPRAKNRGWCITPCSPSEILVPPGLFSLGGVCLEKMYGPRQRCDATAQVRKYQQQHGWSNARLGEAQGCNQTLPMPSSLLQKDANTEKVS